MVSKNSLSYGLNITRKPALGNRPAPAKRKPIFDEDSDGQDDETSKEGVAFEEIGEIGGLSEPEKPPSKVLPASNTLIKNQSGLKKISIGGSKKSGSINTQFGDLSSNLTSKKHADEAEQLDASIYDYDAVYDSLKPKKKTSAADEEKKPKYMSNLIAAAAVRKRDATIAEEKKLARERETEGEEFADKEKFVTSAYKKQQEENRQLEEEERLKEEAEAKKNKGAGMTNFYKNILEKGEQKHAEVVKAAEERIKLGPVDKAVEAERVKSDADIAREINEKRAGTIAVNEEGQVVDKRQLLKGGLNIAPKPKAAPASSASRGSSTGTNRNERGGFVGAGGGKQAMRDPL